MTNQEIVIAIMNNSRAGYVQDAPEELRGHLLEADEKMTEMVFHRLPAELTTEIVYNTGLKLRRTVLKGILKAMTKTEE